MASANTSPVGTMCGNGLSALMASRLKKRALGMRFFKNSEYPVRGSLGRNHSAEMGIVRGVKIEVGVGLLDRAW